MSINRYDWNSFLDKVEEAKESLGNPKVVWYRGQSNASWMLTPTLLRFPDGLSHEQTSFNEFYRSAARLFDKRFNDWELLFDMQHYGIPTRLLDWSEVLGVAVAFILHTDYSTTDYSEAALYVLDPLKLNQKSGIQSIKNLPADKEFEYKEIYWNKKPFSPQYPIAVYPPLQSQRLYAQSGTFTIHGDIADPVDQLCPEAVKKIILPHNAKEGAWEFIKIANLNEYTIYPDILGMARHLRRKIFG